MSQKVLNKRSSVVTEGNPKLPTAQQLDYGEIAINFAEDYETLSIKNDKNDIVTFSSDKYWDKIISEDEYVIASALNDLNERMPVSASQLVNDAGFITGYTETDPTVPSWAKNSTKPSYTLDEVRDGTNRKLSNYATKTNFTAHTADTSIHLTSGNVKSQIEAYGYLTEHQSLDDIVSYAQYSSNDKKIYFYDLSGNQMTNYVDATDFIKDGMISSVTVSNGNLVMSFNTDAGREDITLSLSQIFNASNYYTKDDIDNKGYLTAYTETDPTVPSWAKQSTKPSYTLDEVTDGTSRKLSDYATNTNFTAHTADTTIHFTTGDVKSQIEAYGYITGYTETDPTVPAWAKESTKPSYSASEVGALPTGTTLDNIGDGTTRKLSDYATNANFTAHTSSTSVHVSTSEKNTWNGKQDAINDLTTIRNNASSGATAYTTVTSHTANTTVHVTSSDKTTWNGKQDAINDLTTIRNNASSGASAYNSMITGVTINGSAATVSNKNASINIETGGGGGGSTLPSVTSSDNGKVLTVVDGQWSAVTPVIVYSGNVAPDNLLGNNGDIYLQV